MAVAVTKSTLNRMSIEEFLAWDSGDDRRYELVDGWPVAQSAPSRSHGCMDVIVGAGLKNRLKPAGRPCVVENGSALPIDKPWTVRAPDLLVRCGADWQTADAPILAVDILPPTNSASEMARRRDDYASAGIQQVLEPDQDDARALLWRADGDRWIVETIRDLQGSTTLDIIGVSIPMAEINEDVELTPPDDAGRPGSASAP
ncbi:Uma2 family endonuclease [Niveispirillum lacus]|nr:Uma2 family endonuclease [Niveispirillum lacus]